MVFVIAGNLDEYKNYIRDKAGDNHYVYVLNPESLIGFRDIHGVFIGSWRERRDIVLILDTLITRTTNTDLIKDLYKQVIPAPSLPSLNPITYTPYNPSRTVKELEDEIAEEISRILQKEIDDEVLRNLIPS
jgi:hypothetical protein